jgi:glycosyltransferase involved in cell wall biosynthesis
MRVALVVTGGVDRSGRERVIPALLSFIERQARHHERPCTYPLLGATVDDLGRPRGLRRQYAALVRALRHQGRFDVIHGYWALPGGLAAALAGRRLGIPSVVTLDSGEFVSDPEIEYGLQRSWRHRLAVSATLRLASRLTVCTGHMRVLARAHGVEPAVLPLGVDTTRFTATDRLPGPPWRLLHAASLNPVKDQRTLLHAFRHVLDRVGDAHLDIAGEDTLGGAIQDIARQLGIDRHVTFHGVQPTEALVGLYQRAHLFVLSSRHEAGAVVVLEAAACGVPTVGTAVGYLADWTPDRAITVSPRDPRALGEAIVGALSNPARLADIAAAARAWTLAHDAEWTAREFDRLYRDVATG